jgi:hypothetical protein
MKRFLHSLVCISLVSCASTPAYAEDLLPMPPMPAATLKSVTVDEDILNALLKIAENVAIESARECKTATTWHCQANPVITEYLKRKQKAADK